MPPKNYYKLTKDIEDHCCEYEKHLSLCSRRTSSGVVVGGVVTEEVMLVGVDSIVFRCHLMDHGSRSSILPLDMNITSFCEWTKSTTVLA